MHGYVRNEDGNVHFHMLKLLPLPLATEEGGRAILYEAGLAFAETRDVGWDKVLGAHAFPRFTASGCREGALALNASGEGLLLSAHRWGRRTSGHGGGG